MSLFRQIMLIIVAGMENYQKIVVNPKNDGASRYVAYTYGTDSMPLEIQLRH